MEKLTIDELVKQSHDLALKKGWWEVSPSSTDGPNIPEKLALIHSEISEALEEYRSGRRLEEWTRFKLSSKPEGFGVELADAVIRIADLCGYLGLDLAEMISEKHRYNKTRPQRHGGKRA